MFGYFSVGFVCMCSVDINLCFECLEFNFNGDLICVWVCGDVFCVIFFDLLCNNIVVGEIVCRGSCFCCGCLFVYCWVGGMVICGR